jgi:hypothetical protein
VTRPDKRPASPRRPRPARLAWLLVAAVTLAAPTLNGRPAAAATHQLCETNGHPATNTEIIGRVDAESALSTADRLRAEQDLQQADPTFPAIWRLRDRVDQLRDDLDSLGAVRQVATIRQDATPGSPAQFRAQEELDRLCQQADQARRS